MDKTYVAGLQALIAAGESQTLEFKTSFDKASMASLVPSMAYQLRSKP